jgi:hypothetical protein
MCHCEERSDAAISRFMFITNTNARLPRFLTEARNDRRGDMYLFPSGEACLAKALGDGRGKRGV